MSRFAIDSGEENSYSMPAPKGVSDNRSLTKEQLAAGNWQLARGGSWYLVLGERCDPLPDWDWDWVWDWVALGWPKGHPSVTQGPSLGGFR